MARRASSRVGTERRAVIAFVARRLLFSLAVLGFVTTATFVATLKLGDPVAVLAGAHATPEDRDHVRHFYGLDRPVATQLVMYVGHLARGDLGKSYRWHRSVSSLIAERAPRTIAIGAIAIVLQAMFGIVLGTWAAARRGRVADRVMMGATFIATSTPTFLTGTLLLLGVGYYLGWLPVGGYGVDFADHVACAVLPAITLAVGGSAYYARIVRAEVVEVLTADYVRTARAKGASRTRALLRHALRNALSPLVTDLGTSIGGLLGGTVIVEAIFGWPGLGKLSYDAVLAFDVPVVVGCVVVGTAGVLAGSALSDVAVSRLDPRARG